MLNVFPVLRKIRFKLPARYRGALSAKQSRSRNRPFVIGLLNGLMIACGPLQAMYVMAAGTGSAIEGAKMLFTFGIGTLPVLLSFGFLTSLISGALTSMQHAHPTAQSQKVESWPNPLSAKFSRRPPSGEEAVIASPPHRFGAPCFCAGPV